MTAIGKLYGIGVGPGDPELLTLKAARILREVDVVFTSAQEKSGRSLALEIARPHLSPNREAIPLSFAHTFAGVESREAHRENAEHVLGVLRRPASAAFLTLGDPMTYSTFTYLLEALREREPGIPVEVVPGITSFAAAAAENLEPLAEGDESFAVVSAARGTRRLEEALGAAENVVIMKAYRHTAEVCDLLDARGLGDSVTWSARCTRPDALTARGTANIRQIPAQYMSLFLLRRAGRGGTPR